MTELKSETEQHWPPPHSTLLETALPSMHFSVKLQSHSANKWKARHLLLRSKPHHKQLPCRWCQQLASVMFPIAIVTRSLSCSCFLSTSFLQVIQKATQQQACHPLADNAATSTACDVAKAQENHLATTSTQEDHTAPPLHHPSASAFGMMKTFWHQSLTLYWMPFIFLNRSDWITRTAHLGFPWLDTEQLSTESQNRVHKTLIDKIPCLFHLFSRKTISIQGLYKPSLTKFQVSFVSFPEKTISIHGLCNLHWQSSMSLSSLFQKKTNKTTSTQGPQKPSLTKQFHVSLMSLLHPNPEPNAIVPWLIFPFWMIKSAISFLVTGSFTSFSVYQSWKCSP